MGVGITFWDTTLGEFGFCCVTFGALIFGFSGLSVHITCKIDDRSRDVRRRFAFEIATHPGLGGFVFAEYFGDLVVDGLFCFGLGEQGLEFAIDFGGGFWAEEFWQDGADGLGGEDSFELCHGLRR